MIKSNRIGVYNNSDKLGMDLQKILQDEITFLCVGTDKSSGDSFAPLIGTMLKEKGYNNVIGTLEYPAHAQNLNDKIKDIPSNTTVLAIDSALGSKKNIGSILLNKGRLYSGLALGKELTPIGDFHITGVVNTFDKHCTNFQAVQCASLNNIIKMSDIVANSIQKAYVMDNEKIISIAK